jgi:hypothetical protein
MWGIIPVFTKVGGWFELFLVNTLGFSYHTGTLVYIVLLFGVIDGHSMKRSPQKGRNAVQDCFLYQPGYDRNPFHRQQLPGYGYYSLPQASIFAFRHKKY